MGITISLSLFTVSSVVVITVVPLILIPWLIIIGAPFILFAILPLAATGLSIASIGLLSKGKYIPHITINPSKISKGVIISDGKSNIFLSEPELEENIYNDIILENKYNEKEMLEEVEKILKETIINSNNCDCENKNFHEIKFNENTFFNIKNNILGKIYFKLHLGNKTSAWRIRKHLENCSLCQSQLEFLRRVVPPSKNNLWWNKIPKFARKILNTYFDFPWDQINKVIFTKEELEERNKLIEEKAIKFKK